MIKTKYFLEVPANKDKAIDDQINDFLVENLSRLVDVRFTVTPLDEYSEQCVHAMIVYDTNPKRATNLENWMLYSRGAAAGGGITTTITAGNVQIIDGNGSVTYGDNLITGGLILGGYISGMIESTTISGATTTTDGVHGHGASTDPAGDPVHTHGVNIGPQGDHSHDVNIPSHTHRIANHSHFIDHEHELVLPDHTHPLEYGIYEGPTHTAVTVEVDGTIVPGLVAINAENIDLVPYLATDTDGKILRNAWHTIKITPNDLGRIVATVNTQIFVQSRGGGNH